MTFASFGWTLRLKYGVLAGLAGWLAGWLITLPFELSTAWRYVDGHAWQLPIALAKGMVVWGAFSFFMAITGFVPLMLPLFLIISPHWIVRWRGLLIPGVTLAALLAIYHRMGLVNFYYFRHPHNIFSFFFTATNFFVVTFALAMMCVYVLLAKRRLTTPGLRPPR
jgi:hypothetical protein